MLNLKDINIKTLGELFVTAVVMLLIVAVIVTFVSPILTTVLPTIFTTSLTLTDALLLLILIRLHSK